ncbi:MAG: dUTP diphosphatase [Actinobacteria bacterium]|nr:dUTP diphosphatase [Actinomycetota bacterium]
MPFQRLSPAAVLPARAHPGDAGLDLVAVEDLILGPGERAAVPTGWAVAIPEGMAGLVVPRSGNALRHGLTVANAPGVIDAGYRGELKVILVNLGAEPFAIAAGDRIAQLVVTPASLAFAAEVVALPASDGRGQAGLGSTGRGGPGRGIPLA